jgi:hypothetical protein
MTEKTEWKRRVLVAALNGSVPVKELQGDLDMQSESEHHREAEIARAASERTIAEVKAMEAKAAALARRVQQLEAAEVPLPEYSVGVDVEGGDVGGNVPRTREPPARKGEVPAPHYSVKVTGDTVGGGD